MFRVVYTLEILHTHTHTENSLGEWWRSANILSCRSLLLVPQVKRLDASPSQQCRLCLCCPARVFFFLIVQGDGLAKIAWAFLRPIGVRGECNVGVRSGKGSSPSIPSEKDTRQASEGPGRPKQLAVSMVVYRSLFWTGEKAPCNIKLSLQVGNPTPGV